MGAKQAERFYFVLCGADGGFVAPGNLQVTDIFDSTNKAE